MNGDRKQNLFDNLEGIASISFFYRSPWPLSLFNLEYYNAWALKSIIKQ